MAIYSQFSCQHFWHMYHHMPTRGRRERRGRRGRRGRIGKMNLGKAMRDAADPLPFHGGEAWQGEPPFDVWCQKHVNFKTD